MLSTHVTVSSMHGTLCPVHILCRVYSTCVQYTSQQCLFCTLCLVHRCSALFVRILHIYTVYTVYSVYIYGVYCVYCVYCIYCAYTVYIVYSMQQCLRQSGLDCTMYNVQCTMYNVHYTQLWLSLPYTVYTQTAYTAYTVYTLYSAYNVDLRCIYCVHILCILHILCIFSSMVSGLDCTLCSAPVVLALPAETPKQIRPRVVPLFVSSILSAVFLSFCLCISVFLYFTRVFNQSKSAHTPRPLLSSLVGAEFKCILSTVYLFISLIFP